MCPHLADVYTFLVIYILFFLGPIALFVVHLQGFYETMKTDEKIIKYIKDVRKPKNDESFVKLARAALSHLQF